MAIDTVIEDHRWTALGLERVAERATDATLRHLGLEPGAWEIALLGCDDERIAGLSAEFRGKRKPTNVLSWPSADRSPARPGDVPGEPDPSDGPELGDIAIAWDTCEREAADAGRAIADHVCHLLVHGTLHLLGYDHIRDEDADLMERIEVEVLATLGIANPY